MHESHRTAVKQHMLAARAHRSAAEHYEKGDNPAGNWHTEHALLHAKDAYGLAKEAHTKSGQIESL